MNLENKKLGKRCTAANGRVLMLKLHSVASAATRPLSVIQNAT